MSSITTTRRTAAGLAPLLLVAAAPVLAQAQARAIERHLPQTPPAAIAPLPTPNALPADQNATPIGPTLTAIVLLGPTEAVRADAGPGVTVGAVERLRPEVAQAQIRARLTPFLGQPLSRKLIAEIEAAVARDYRDRDYPFVSLSTPEQVIGGGRLQIRVIEFHVGEVSVTGVSDKAAQAVRRRVDLQPGQPINARDLTYDLNGLNRYPFRQLQAAFTPGAALGATDITLSARPLRPWQVYAGYGNDGSPATGWDRYFVGGAVGGLLGRDSVLSVQATASRDAIAGDSAPRYRSAALNYTLPVAWRGLIEASADTVVTYQQADPFTVRLKAVEASLGYRTFLSGLPHDHGLTDARLGVETSRQTGTTYFSGVDIYEVSLETWQLYAGLHHAAGDFAGAASWDLAVHLSPGDITGDNSSLQMALYTQGRVTNARYGYLTGSYNRATSLGSILSLKIQVFGQVSSKALPQTAQAAIGGASLVRGYSLDDGAVDTALIVRNELHGPGLAWDKRWRGGALDPYAFLDLGYGRDNHAHHTADLASIGAGANLRLTRQVVLKLDLAAALTDNAKVNAGDLTAHTRLQIVF